MPKTNKFGFTAYSSNAAGTAADADASVVRRTEGNGVKKIKVKLTPFKTSRT